MPKFIQSKFNLRTIFTDINLLLFILNTALVYGFIYFGESYATISKITRLVMMTLSIIVLQVNPKSFIKSKLFILIVLMLFLLPLSENFSISINKIIPLVFLIVYLFLLSKYILRKYNKLAVKILISLVALSLVLPFILMFIDLSVENIFSGYYGSNLNGFASNNLGWSSVALLTCAIEFLYWKVGNIKKIIIVILILGLFIILIASGTRSALLSLSISLIILLFRKGKVLFKGLIILSIIPIFAYFLAVDSNVLEQRMEVTNNQIEKDDFSRLDYLIMGFERWNKNPIKVLVGEGFYANHYHNSYATLLFGYGVPIFLLFFISYVYKPIVFFLRNKYLFFVPLFIIPFFEGVFSAGQFLSFQWFLVMILGHMFYLNKKQL